MNYQNGKVYKIESHLGDKVYIGSTTKKYLSQRMTAHRKNYNQWKNHKRDLTTSFLMFDEYGVENCNIVLLESYPCNSKDELTSREAHYIRTLQCINKCIPGRTSRQYDIDNKEQIQERKKEYYIKNKERFSENYQANKEAIAERKKISYEKNKDVVKEKAKKYREENIDKVKEKSKQYRDANKDEINKKQRERYALKKQLENS